MALTEQEKAILEFERGWWTLDDQRDMVIEERFGLSSAAYYEVLNDLVDRADAMQHDPLVVRRLRRLRDRKRRVRLDSLAAAEGSEQ